MRIHIYMYMHAITIDDKGSNEFEVELKRLYGRPFRKEKGGRNVVTK